MVRQEAPARSKSVYRGPNQADCLRQLAADAPKAEAAGFVPVWQAWSTDQGAEVLTLIYERRTAALDAPANSPAPGDGSTLRSAAVVPGGLLHLDRPGILELAGGRVTFTTQKGRELDAPVETVRASFGWNYVGLGFTLKAEGKVWRYSFGQAVALQGEAGAVQMGAAMGGAAGGVIAVLSLGATVRTMAQGRATTAAWKAALQRTGAAM